MSVNPCWENADDYYADDPRRESSREIPLPGSWYAERWDLLRRIYWIEQTGEVVLIASQPGEIGTPWQRRQGAPVELIGWAESSDLALKTLNGWSSQQGQLKSLYWARKRFTLHDTPSVPGTQVTPAHRDRAQENAGSLF